MMEQPRSKIHPGWFVAGGAGVALVAICLLVSLCGIALALLIAPPNSSNDRRLTEVAVVPTTPPEATPLVTMTALPDNFPTRLPILGTVGGVPNQPTSVLPPIQNSSEPAQAVMTYYTLVSQERYDQTWNMLTDAFKERFNCCAPNYNYTGYVDWWNSVDRVEFGEVRTVSQTEDRAVVYAEIYYVMNDGNRSSLDGSYFMMVYDPAMGIWRLDDRRTTL